MKKFPTTIFYLISFPNVFVLLIFWSSTSTSASLTSINGMLLPSFGISWAVWLLDNWFQLYFVMFIADRNSCSSSITVCHIMTNENRAQLYNCWKPSHVVCSTTACISDAHVYLRHYYAPAPKVGGIKRWCASDVWRLSVAYIVPKSRTERRRKTKIGTDVAHVTCDLDTTFKVKIWKVNLQGAEAYCGGLPHSLLCLSIDTSILEKASASL